jgi:tetratricopeptide (TPR) repeat protein
MWSPFESRRYTLLLILLSSGWMPAAEKSKWLKFTTPHFEIYTDAGERKGRDALKRLEQLRQALEFIPRSQNAPQPPVRVFLFDNDRDYKNYKPAGAGPGYHQAGADRDYLVMRGTGGDTYKTVYHEYTHMVFNRSSVRVPRWIEEGTAEYYSTAEPDGKTRVKLGKPIAAHQKLLKNSAQWLKPELFQSARRDSIVYKEQLRSGIFYAQPWAMVHMFLSAERYKTSVPRYAELLAEGTAYAPAFMDAFGMPVETAWKELAFYIKSNKWPNGRFNLAPDSISALKPEKAELKGLALPLAELQLLIGNDKPAEAALKQIAAEEESAEALALLGTLALRSRRFDAAKANFEQSIERNPELAAAHFGLAIALRETRGGHALIVEHLEKCVELSPNFAEAHSVLGALAASGKHYAEAVEHYQRAASAYPRQAAYWHGLALAHYYRKQPESARRAAYKAYFAASTEQETAGILAVLDLVDGKQVQVAAHKADVSALAAIAERRGDTKLDGTLIRVDCIGQAARFHVMTQDEKRVLLYSLRPQEIALKNTTSETREFVCGPQRRLAVRVEYNARPDSGLRSAGDVVSIEFRSN